MHCFAEEICLSRVEEAACEVRAGLPPDAAAEEKTKHVIASRLSESFAAGRLHAIDDVDALCTAPSRGSPLSTLHLQSSRDRTEPENL